MSRTDSSFSAGLSHIFTRPTGIVGIGNTLRSDDAVGCYIADQLEACLADGTPHQVLNAEDVIENYVFRLAESPVEHILVVDAVQGSGQPAGSLVLGRLTELETGSGVFLGQSTHKLALSMASSILEQHGKQVYLLGIAAENIDFGMQMSPDIQDSAEMVIALLAGHAGRSH
ncbi:hydrogenase maturation protease [Chitinilyticum piscinae]|uniref:Hydrogenase maturation protease n=1 Tax=Chitinilyticum piscinae TaxID=2866724 RepID=A0A8J7K8R9_9NEIS|nr:hydrogenase maturation protease [Chitinilyticum piscinae]MBE9610018.1 hydrogenase maturation protease [Chitinilyticum piscinae]